jgi:hypothetical protein
VSGVKARTRRGIRAALCVSLALAGLAAVLMVAGRGLPPSADPVPGPTVAPVTTALPAAVASEPRAVADRPAAASMVPAPVVTPRLRRDEGVAAGGERWEAPSLDADDWREQVAAAVGRQAVEGAPRNAGAVHTHLSLDGHPEARAPSVMLTAAPAVEEKLHGWDGGKFWFGPTGLVRMKEAQP